MIASKQIAFGRGSKRKPYDAEIAYLESTGTQWIDTRFKPDTNTSVEVEFSITNLSAMGIFGSRTAAYDNSFLLFAIPSNRYFRYDIGSLLTAVNVNPDVASRYKFIGDNKFYIIEDLTLSTRVQSIIVEEKYSGLYNIVLFAVNTKGTIYNRAIAKIFSFRLNENGELILDLIPVRKGNIGYMYDRVSGQLFGNQGTGEFVLGADL